MAAPAQIRLTSIAEVEAFINADPQREYADIAITSVVVREALQMRHLLNPKANSWNIENYEHLLTISDLHGCVKYSVNLLSSFLGILDNPADSYIDPDETEQLKESGQHIVDLVRDDPASALALEGLQVGEHLMAAANAVLAGDWDIRDKIHRAAQHLSAVPNLVINLAELND